MATRVLKRPNGQNYSVTDKTVRTGKPKTPIIKQLLYPAPVLSERQQPAYKLDTVEAGFSGPIVKNWRGVTTVANIARKPSAV